MWVNTCTECDLYPAFYRDFVGYKEAKLNYDKVKLGWQLICFGCGKKLIGEEQEELVEAWNKLNLVESKVYDFERATSVQALRGEL